MLKRTSLYDCHRSLGARLVEFGGWEMPVQYSGIIEEHRTVRAAVGLFDIAHMGEVFVSGPDCARFLNALLTNDVRKISPGKGQYTLLCNPSGCVIDDLYLYQLEAEKFLLIINASRIDADLAWICHQHELWGHRADVVIEDASARLGAVALQGPKARSFIDVLAAMNGTAARKPSGLQKNEVIEVDSSVGRLVVACTGYTGEDGFEVIASNESLPVVWDLLLKAGQEHGIRACGLGARDTLRLEACYPLYGHELDENSTPLDAGLGFFVALEKGEFNGRSALLSQKRTGLKKKCIAFQMSGPSAPPRAGYPIRVAGDAAGASGIVTSGSQSPTLNCGIGMGYVPQEFAAVGTRLEIEIRGRNHPAAVVKKPFHRMKV